MRGLVGCHACGSQAASQLQLVALVALRVLIREQRPLRALLPRELARTPLALSKPASTAVSAPKDAMVKRRMSCFAPAMAAVVPEAGKRFTVASGKLPIIFVNNTVAKVVANL